MTWNYFPPSLLLFWYFWVLQNSSTFIYVRYYKFNVLQEKQVLRSIFFMYFEVNKEILCCIPETNVIFNAKKEKKTLYEIYKFVLKQKKQ